METFRTSCTGCHLVRGEGGNEDIFAGTAQVSGAAPNLTHFASRGIFAGGVYDIWVDQDDNGEIDVPEMGQHFKEADIKAWLKDPPSRKPMYPQGSRGMPNLNLTDEQIDSLVAYLVTLE
jgi:mono/diheme cytochrome c family protein